MMGVEHSCGASGASCAGAKLLWYAKVQNRAQNENENKQLKVDENIEYEESHNYYGFV